MRVERMERENTLKLDATRRIYAKVREVMPVCPVCGGAWNESFVCREKHTQDQIIAKQGQDERQIGELKTDRDEVVAEVCFEHDASVKIKIRIRENQVWSGKVFKSVKFTLNLIVLSPTLVPDRELIILWLSELDEAKQALKVELAFVEDLKHKVTNGEVICLTFNDRGNGIMVAEYKRELVQAPYDDDQSRYPNAGESWWCHVIPGNGPAKIALYRKVKTTTVDVERVLKDGLEMFPGLPKQLLQ
jgi:hypothetical protein